MEIWFEWITDNIIEVFGAVTGILYVFLEIRQTIWLWPVGIVTSAVYIWVFFSGKLYADMSLQGYYLVISVLGWYWWLKGTGGSAHDAMKDEKMSRAGKKEKEGREGKENRGTELTGEGLNVTRIDFRTGLALTAVFLILYASLHLILGHFTDSPVPGWDSFITSLSITATWMLARKIYEHWILWIVVNTTASVLFLTRGLYPTVILYSIYCIMSFAGLRAWRRTMKSQPDER
jgi:nicotinamide mononucleotide transporter